MTKQTPKSCSCRQCTRAKGTPMGNFFMKKEERTFRHEQNAALRQGSEDIVNAGVRSRVG